MTRIATFYSHFGAISFKRMCVSYGVPARMMPVPRALSSSCGTCVRYESESLLPDGEEKEDIEQIVEVYDDSYVCVYKNQ